MRAGAAHTVTWYGRVADKRGRQQSIDEAAGRARRTSAFGLLCGATASAGEAAAAIRGTVATFARVATSRLEHGRRGVARYAPYGWVGFPALDRF